MATKETKAAKKDFTAHLFAVNLIEKLMEFFKKLMTSNLLEFCRKWLTMLGHIAIIIAAALGLLFALIYAIRRNEFDAFLYGIGWVLLIFVAQYTANKFLDAGNSLIKENPSRLSSNTFLNCFGFIAMIGGAVILILHIIAAIKGAGLTYLLEGIGKFLFLEFLAIVSFNPKEVTIKIEKGNNAGQEAIGIVTFFIKGIMKLVPIIFGAGVILGTVMLFIDGLGLFGSEIGIMGAFARCFGSAWYIFIAAILPFLSYIFFVFFYLLIDLIKAILSIPEH